MKTRDPQLALRLDAAPDRAARWRDGATLAYLGGQVTLQLDTDRRQATLDGAVLHLPLPPDASARQVQDAAEAWQRREAGRVLKDVAARTAAATGRPTPALLLSFAARSGWIQIEADALRCNWHLIEQPLGVIELVVARAVAAMPRTTRNDDLFAALA
jgi:predicted metal-dependent hydrolase